MRASLPKTGIRPYTLPTAPLTLLSLGQPSNPNSPGDCLPVNCLAVNCLPGNPHICSDQPRPDREPSFFSPARMFYSGARLSLGQPRNPDSAESFHQHIRSPRWPEQS